MPFVDKIAPKPYRERFTVQKWHDGDDIHTAQPYETIYVSVWYDEYNNEIIDPIRIQALEEQVQDMS